MSSNVEAAGSNTSETPRHANSVDKSKETRKGRVKVRKGSTLEGLTRDLDTRTDQVTSLETKLNTAQEALMLEKVRVEQGKEREAALLKQLEAAQAKEATNQTDLKKAQDKNQGTKLKMDELLNEIGVLNMRLEQEKNDVHELRMERITMKAENSKLETENRSISNSYESMKETTKKQIAQLSVDKMILESNLSKIRNTAKWAFIRFFVKLFRICKDLKGLLFAVLKFRQLTQLYEEEFNKGTSLKKVSAAVKEEMTRKRNEVVSQRVTGMFTVGRKKNSMRTVALVLGQLNTSVDEASCDVSQLFEKLTEHCIFYSQNEAGLRESLAAEHTRREEITERLTNAANTARDELKIAHDEVAQITSQLDELRKEVVELRQKERDVREKWNLKLKVENWQISEKHKLAKHHISSQRYLKQSYPNLSLSSTTHSLDIPAHQLNNSNTMPLLAATGSMGLPPPSAPSGLGSGRKSKIDLRLPPTPIPPSLRESMPNLHGHPSEKSQERPKRQGESGGESQEQKHGGAHNPEEPSLPHPTPLKSTASNPNNPSRGARTAPRHISRDRGDRGRTGSRILGASKSSNSTSFGGNRPRTNHSNHPKSSRKGERGGGLNHSDSAGGRTRERETSRPGTVPNHSSRPGAGGSNHNGHFNKRSTDVLVTPSSNGVDMAASLRKEEDQLRRERERYGLSRGPRATTARNTNGREKDVKFFSKNFSKLKLPGALTSKDSRGYKTTNVHVLGGGGGNSSQHSSHINRASTARKVGSKRTNHGGSKETRKTSMINRTNLYRGKKKAAEEGLNIECVAVTGDDDLSDF